MLFFPNLILRKQPTALFFWFILIAFTIASAKPGTALAQPPISDNNQQSSSRYLLVIVSQRNAENIVEAAHQFKEKYPTLNIVARTDLQLSNMPAPELATLISSAGGIFATGLYGPSVALVEKHFEQRKQQQVIINSDHRLVKLSYGDERAVFESEEVLQKLAKITPDAENENWLQDLIQDHPKQKDWLTLRAFWQAGGDKNTVNLIGFLFQAFGLAELSVSPPLANAPVRWFYKGQYQDNFPPLNTQPVLAILDHAGGSRPADTRLLAKLCDRASREIDHQCVAAIANWGEAGIDALHALKANTSRLSAVVMLQDFVIGAGEGRAAATEILQTLNVPVIKAIKMRDRTQVEYQLSADGIAQEKIYYQVAMPELQGASQPLIVGYAGNENIDSLTGIEVQSMQANNPGISSLLNRVANWYKLQKKDNKDKRIAIIYYNHPPGRHNIGADNLDVPASLWEILHRLKSAGYNTGELPESQDSLLNLLQQKGINLPRHAKALREMSAHISNISNAEYANWLDKQPSTIQQEMRYGPFGLLHQQILVALQHNTPNHAQQLLDHTMEEVNHLLEGLDHPGRERVIKLLGQLQSCYLAALANDTKRIHELNHSSCMDEAPSIIAAIRNTGIEGLGGWGPAPGNVMVLDQRLLLPGIQFGNVFIGPQPPRGWEINEELLHANLAFPPPHQYLAFYHYLKDTFKADALVHLGRHSTYEFLPRRSVGVGPDDYSQIIAGDLPGIYPYIVDGVGEGIQAKRRGLAVMVDHLTPPLKSTPLYDELLQLRQLVESFESHHGKDNHSVSERLIQQIREKITTLNLQDELAESMSAELAIMGISFDEVDDDLLVHEIGHYLTNLQERFMPLGLHIYGKEWSGEAKTMMLDSMASSDSKQQSTKEHQQQERKQWSLLLDQSPEAEMRALLAGLNGEYIVPGPGNDPIRSPQSLPTGRNFYALDSSLIPSRTAWNLGKEMAQQARNDNSQNPDKREAIVLWASDVVRDEGVMIAFGLDMLGVEPVWNSRGLVTGIKKQTLNETRVRRDTVFTSSGLFRDLYGQQMRLLNQATLLALDASADLIARDYPALITALQHTLAPINKIASGGNEALNQNQIAAHWVNQTRELLKQGYGPADAGITASYRVFGDAPGAYGAGINRMAERSGAWQHRSELADVYLRRLGHSYSMNEFGKPSHKAFTMQLKSVENTYFGRSSNLYGLIDNNDAFDYLGGLSLAVETLSGQQPDNFVIDHSDPNNVKTQPLSVALRQEFRGRFLNPEWLQGLIHHGYAGARTMGSEFLEYLWGWQITNPTMVGDWAWQEVKAVYLDDRYQLGLDTFLEQGHNVHVKTNMMAIMLVAINKEFWQADEETRQALAMQFAELAIVHGLPGSGHTDPDHPMLPWLEQYLAPELWQQLDKVITEANPASTQQTTKELEVHRLSEITTDLTHMQQPAANEQTQNQPQAAQQKQEKQSHKENSNGKSINPMWLIMFVLVAVSVVLSTMIRAVRQAKRG